MKPGIELKGKRVLVVGLARTGVATALFCAARGARVTVSEGRDEKEVGDAVEELRAAGRSTDMEFEFGGHRAETFLRQDLIVPSPGVPLRLPALTAAQARGIPIWSELELAWRFLHGRLICVTGSNGKTTTTALTGHILHSAGVPVQVAGNIGTPLIAHIDDSREAGWTVVEASSFQLEAITAFRPDVAVFLNLTPDHLDRHASVEEYGAAKALIFKNQTEADFAVLNADDAATSRYAPSRPRVFWFSRQKRVAQGCFLRGGELVFRQEGAESVFLRRDDIPLRGAHNVENVLAAAAAATLAGVNPRSIAEAVRSFAGVEHRLEFVANIAGVDYFNDSKATNVDATQKALDAFPGNLLVILGGKDKGSDYTVLREALRQRAKMVLLIGSAAEKIATQLAGAIPAITRAETIERAVSLAAEHARPGDTVLLAPACASFDQFENFEHRGRVFKQLVHAMADVVGVEEHQRALPHAEPWPAQTEPKPRKGASRA